MGLMGGPTFPFIWKQNVNPRRLVLMGTHLFRPPKICYSMIISDVTL